MAITLLASASGANKNKTTLPTASLNTNGGTMLSSASKNNGGVIGGVGYFGEKIGLGALSGIEGIWDYAAGGIAKLFGYDKWAERRFANDWVNYSHADEWYNPSEGWKIAGDVAGGIGSSLPSIGGALLGAAITAGTAGAASPIGAALISGSISAGIAGLGAAGNATKEAYRETGKLTGKEFGYGALSGITEAGLEFATAGLAKGSGRIVNAIGKKAATKLAADTAKETAETMAKTGAKKIFKQLGEDFVTEAIEEGLSEILSPQYQKITYNPDAENATLQEIGYAAMIGGLSGMLMSGSSIGVRSAYNTTENFLSGRKSAESGSYKSIIKQGKVIADGEDIHNTGIEANQSVRDVYNKLIDSLKKNNGIATTEEVLNRIESGNISFKANEQMYLGKLKKANAVATIYPYIERSALGLVLNPEASAERYKTFGIKDADGNAINVTADDILSGIDKNLLEKFKEGTLTKKESVAFAKSYRKALSENSTLATLAVAEATGQIMVDTKRITESILNGENLANTADINRIIERGSVEEKNALSQALGVDLNTLTRTELGIKLAEYNASNGTSEWASQMKRIREAAEINEDSATPIPETLRKNMNDGVYRLTNDDKSINIAIVKEGESFHLYDYDNQRISRSLTSKEVNSILKEINQNRKAKLENQFDNTNELSAEAKQLDELLRDKIPEYKSMSEPNKEAMRMTMRQALAHGVTEDVALIATKVAQRSGLNVIFDAIQAQGDGALSGNTIYINPKLSEKRVCEVVLGHEMFHKIFAEGSKKSWKLYEKAKALIEGGDNVKDTTVEEAVKNYINPQSNVNTENLSEADAVRAKYKAFYKKNKVDSATATAIAEEEVAAAGVEKVINSKEAWDYILGEEPSFATKVLSFFGKASKEYAAFNSLSSQAKKFLREYKKLFNEISAKNQGNNALSIALEKAGVKKMPSDTAPYTRAKADGEGEEKDIDEVRRYAEDINKRHSFSSISYSFFGDKEVGVADFENGSYKETEGYKSYVNECLNNMKQTRDGFTEESARKEVESSIQGIVDVAVAMKKAGYDILDTKEKRETRDSKNRLLFSSLEPNSDYITSSDISTICDKRINFQEIYDEIVRRETELKVPKGKRFFDNIDNYFIIHKIMADKGLTQPCRECYVESMRKNLAPMANAFLQLVQETNPENKSNPQLYNKSGKNKGELKSNNAKLREKLLKAIETEEYDITVDTLDEEMLSTDKGLTTLRLQAPLIYEAFNSFYGQSKPKMPKSATPFRFGELTALLTNDKGKINKALVEKIKSTGGFRLQSYSDFQIQNFADVLQVIFEAGTLGLNGHAYTKVPAFLDATKGTNLKRNISIFMYKDGKEWKLDRNDSFPYKLDKIYDIVKADKSGNTSIIAVVQNEDMAAFVMANDNIGYFIPFHKSGLKMATVRETIVKEGGREIKGYSGIKDHTRQQTEVWAFNENGHKAYTKVSKGINIYEFWDFDNKENLSKNELIEKNLKRYIDECKKARYVPKFREYLLNNEAVLNNVLKYAKELGTMPSNATIEDISFEYKGYRIPYGYYKCLGDFGMFKPNGEASPIETLSLKDYNFKEAVDFFSDAKTLRRNEILQQIANGEERERYRNSDMTTAEIAEEVQSKRNKVVEEVVSGEYKNKRFALTDSDKDYMDAVNRGDMETAQRMVDEAALEWGAATNENARVPRPIHLYHGTGAFGFTKFRDGRIYATVSEAVAAGYNRGRGLGRVRSSSLGYIHNDGTVETVIKNAKNVLGATFYKLDDVAKENIISKADNILSDVANKISKLDESTDYSKAAEFFDYLTEKYGEDKANKLANDLDSLHYMLSGEYTVDEIIEDGKWLIHDLERYHNWKQNLSELWSEEQEAVKKSSLDNVFRYLLGFEYGDAIIDIEFGLGRLIDDKQKLVNRNGNLVYLDDIIEAVEFAKDTGIYDLYGNPGKKPLVIDEGKRFWDAIPFENGFRSTDYIVKWAKDNGYTSVLFKTVLDPSSGGSANVYADEWVFFDSNQVKSADPVTYDDNGNVIPLSERFNAFNPDIRYALTDADIDEIFGDIGSDFDFDIDAILDKGVPVKSIESNLTVGQIKKDIANKTHYKVYSKKTALDVISKIQGITAITQKSMNEIADAVWQGFNECNDYQSRRNFASDISKYIVAKLITESKIENPDIVEAQERLSYLSTYIGSITFHPEYLSEIRHIADKKGLKSIIGRWGFKNRNGSRRVPLDVFTCDIAREMPGMSYLEEMHPAEALMELDALYERDKATIKDKWLSAYWDTPDSEIAVMATSIEADIMKAFESEGEKSFFTKLVENKIEYYSNRAEFWKAEHDKIKGRDRMHGLLMSVAQKMKDLRLGTFANSTQAESDTFKNSIEKLSKIQFRGNLTKPNTTRKIFAELLSWYNTKNPVLEYVDENNSGYYVQSIADMLEYIASGDTGFSVQDLGIMYDVMSYFVKFVENYNKVFRNGKMVEALPLAKKYIEIAKGNEQIKTSLFAKLSASRYAQMFNDPASLVRRMDFYESGFYTEMFEDLRDAAVDAEISEMEVMRAYDEFLQNNKKYMQNASKELVEYRGHKISKIQLIDLYMTMKRQQAWAGVALNGFTYKDLEGKKVRVTGFVTDENVSLTSLKEAIEAEQKKIEKSFTDLDKQYMQILEKGYNEDARKLKADRDIQRLGFTNATTDYYYPIKRADIAKNVDTSDIKGEYDRVSNSSFNKDIVKGAKQKLAIESADARYRRHIHAVCQYAYLSPAIEAYNRLYNMDISGNKNDPVSVRTATENIWSKGNEYFVKLISDIQGIPAGTTEGMAALSFIRGSYAKFQLGANPKVWLTQLSSLFAASSILDMDSIAKGAFVSAEGVEQYCPLAELRKYDNTAAMAQAVIDKQGKEKGKLAKVLNKTEKISDVLMKPIGMMDNFTIHRLFGACQVQVEKNGGAKVGTDANKIEAGKLLKKVILETQQNAISTERSSAMRSGNEIIRALTMFRSDAMKTIGRVIDAFGEISVLKARLKSTTDANVKAELKTKLKAAHRKARKATMALMLGALFMASIAQLFRWLYDKEKDEDETVAEMMIVDAAGNMLGGLPIWADAYAALIEGYDIDNYTYSTVNDLLSSAKGIIDLGGAILDGSATSQDKALQIRKATYSIGQITGLPTRNLYNVFFGLTKRFSPETAYKIDNVFYKKNYQSDLYKAIEENDDRMATYILSLLYNERMNDDLSEDVHNELYVLSSKGYKVIPKKAPNKITIGDEEYELNEQEIEAIRSNYSSAQAYIDKLISSAEYKALSDEKKSEAINKVFGICYDISIEDVLGIDRGNKVLLSKAISVEKLAMYQIAISGLESDKDKQGNTINGSKRKKVVSAINKLNITRQQKLLLIASSGYSLSDNEQKTLLRYILGLRNITKAQKEELAKLCGFNVKNGRIILK